MKLYIYGDGVERCLLVSWRYTPIGKGNTYATTCTIREKGVRDDVDSERDVEFWGVAYQNKVDEFSKETGRKLSLRRALEQTDLTRFGRQLVWQAYFNRK